MLEANRVQLLTKFQFLSSGDGAREKSRKVNRDARKGKDHSSLSNHNDSQVAKKSNSDRQTCLEILKDRDERATKEQLETFVKKLKDIMSILQILEDPLYDTIDALTKIESNINYLSEARNYLALKFS